MITIKDINNIDKYKKIIKETCSQKVRIGIFGEDDSELVKRAAANEFGAHITPKKGKFLTIPVNKKAKGKNPRDFNDLFVLKADSGELFLVRENGENGLEFFYWLARSVNIPERSFIRSGFDENLDKIEKVVGRAIGEALSNMTVLDFELVGDYVAGQIKKYMTDLSSPPNSELTMNMKGSSNPLIDTGRMRQSITHKVVRK